MLALSDNPPILTPLAASLSEIEGNWWVARTFSRCEKALAWDLVRERIPYFLPMIPRTIFSGGRKRRGMAPLFSSYVFIAGTHENRVAAFHTGRICQAIPVAEQPDFVDELRRVQLMLSADGALVLHPQIVPGARCRVINGKYEGIVGKIARFDHQTQVIIDLTVLGQSLGVPMDPECIEVLDETTSALRDLVAPVQPPHAPIHHDPVQPAHKPPAHKPSASRARSAARSGGQNIQSGLAALLGASGSIACGIASVMA